MNSVLKTLKTTLPKLQQNLKTKGRSNMSKRNKFDFNRLYKHKNNTDIAFQLTATGCNGYSQLISVRWFNIVNPDNIHLIEYQDSVTVLDEQSHDWVEYAFLNEHNEWKVKENKNEQ
jgi:hypothetical protein